MEYEYLDQKNGDQKTNDHNRFANNKMARAMIKIIEDECEEYPSIIDSFKAQLKKDRTISEKQFKILIENLPKA